MTAAREYTPANVAEMRANAVAVRARCFYPKAAPKPQPSQVVTLISYRGYEPPKPLAPVTPPPVPAWQTTPTMFEEHVFAYRAAVKIQEMIAAGEIELVNVERVSIAEIVDKVLLEFPGILVSDIKSRRRTRAIVPAKHMAIYQVKKQRPDLSYPAVARWFGLDHSSAIFAVKKTAKMLGDTEYWKAQEAQKEASA